MYTCLCIDNAIHITACKHIHVIYMQFEDTINSKSSPSEDQSSSVTPQDDVQSTFHHYHPHPSQPDAEETQLN